MNKNFNDMVNACEEGDIDTVRRLLPETDVKLFQSQPIRSAAFKNHIDIVKLLIPHSDLSVKGYSVLNSASVNHNEEMFELLSEGVNFFEKDFFCSPFASLCYYGWLDQIKRLDSQHNILEEHWNEALDVMIENNNIDVETLKFVLSKTTHAGREKVIPHMIANKKTHELKILIDHHGFDHQAFDYFCSNLRADVAEKMIDVYKEEKHGALNQDSICRAFDEAASYADWFGVQKLLPFLDVEHAKKKYHTMMHVVGYSDIEMYNYFIDLGFVPTQKSFAYSCKNDKKMAELQFLNEGATNIMSITALHFLAENNWNDVLFKVLPKTSLYDISNHKVTGKFYIEDIEENLFQSAVERKNYDALKMVLKKTTTDRPGRFIAWLPALCLNFYHDEIFMDMVETHTQTDFGLIVRDAFEEKEHDKHTPMNKKMFLKRMLKNCINQSLSLADAFVLISQSDHPQSLRTLRLLEPHVQWDGVEGNVKSDYEQKKSNQDKRILQRSLRQANKKSKGFNKI